MRFSIRIRIRIFRIFRIFRIRMANPRPNLSGGARPVVAASKSSRSRRSLESEIISLGIQNISDIWSYDLSKYNVEPVAVVDLVHLPEQLLPAGLLPRGRGGVLHLALVVSHEPD